MLPSIFRAVSFFEWWKEIWKTYIQNYLVIFQLFKFCKHGDSLSVIFTGAKSLFFAKTSVKASTNFDLWISKFFCFKNAKQKWRETTKGNGISPCFMLERKVILVRALDCSLWGSLVAISVIHHYLFDNFISFSWLLNDLTNPFMSDHNICFHEAEWFVLIFGKHPVWYSYSITRHIFYGTHAET